MAKRYVKTMIKYMPAVLCVSGAVAGWLYYAYKGCVTGACPIRQNPMIMTAYGAFLGLLTGYIIRPEADRK